MICHSKVLNLYYMKLRFLLGRESLEEKQPKQLSSMVLQPANFNIKSHAIPFENFHKW
jgi:hypothetical protein